MNRYEDTTDGTFTWNVALYHSEDTIRGLRVNINEVALNFNTDVTSVIQEIRTPATNRLLFKLTIGDGITIVDNGLEIEFNYSTVYTTLPAGNYVHDVFFVQDNKRIPYIFRSEFTINKSVGVVDES